MKSKLPNRKHCQWCNEFLPDYAFSVVAHPLVDGYLKLADFCKRCALDRKKAAEEQAAADAAREFNSRQLEFGW